MSPNLGVELLRGICPTVSVSLLSADMMSLGDDLAALEQAGVRLVHFDVMDGRFTPKMTVGPPFVEAVKIPLLKDVHLMVQDPEKSVGEYVTAGADMIVVHPEASRHVHRALQQLAAATNTNDSARGVIRGVALNPGTPLEVLEPLLDELQVVFLLAVNPGWGGQRFLASTLRRIDRARRIIAESKKEILLGVDGGITRNNMAEVARTGVDIVVTGSAVFENRKIVESARFMLETLRSRAAS